MSESALLQRGQPPARPIVIGAVAIALISLVAGWVGQALAPDLVNSRPLLAMTLNPRNAILVLVTNQLEAVEYYTVGFFRLIFSDPVNYLLGFWFGDRILAWVKKRSRTYGQFVDSGSEGFRKYSGILIFAMPNNIICAFAGASGVKLRTFALLNVSGTIARLWVVRQFGGVFESPIEGVLDWIAQYRLPLLVVSVLAVLWTVFGEFRGDNSELSALRDLTNDEAAASGESDGEANDSGTS